VSGHSSLRLRVVVGWMLWTLGVITLAVLAGAAIAHRKPAWIPVLHLSLILFTCVILVIAGMGMIRRGLSTFAPLQRKLADVREGRARRVDGRYPTELQPLVDEVNALLDDREQRVARAVARAGDLAHGLKTPLAVLTQEAARAGSAGQDELSDAIAQQVARMRRQIDYHLAQARAVASGASSGARASVAACAESLARTLERLYVERGLAIDLDVAPDHVVRAAREDLDEMVGNLLDNGCKWAKSRVTLSSAREDAAVVLTVDDDGPGIAASMRSAVLQRGVRADEAAAGSGLGLAIVRDLAELYGGSIALDASPAGGLRARLRLPSMPIGDR
jgi:signal transduction histidine kinase